MAAHGQSTRLWLQQSKVQIPGRDWWCSPVTLLLGVKNRGWSEVVFASVYELIEISSVEFSSLGFGRSRT